MTDEAKGNVEVSGICHIEIPAPELAKAKIFYETVFGWTVEENEGGYWFFQAGDSGGAFSGDKEVASEGVTLVLQTTDIPAKLLEIVEAGGEKLTEKTEIGEDLGFLAYFRDTNGNKLAIWSKN